MPNPILTIYGNIFKSETTQKKWLELHDPLHSFFFHHISPQSKWLGDMRRLRNQWALETLTSRVVLDFLNTPSSLHLCLDYYHFNFGLGWALEKKKRVLARTACFLSFELQVLHPPPFSCFKPRYGGVMFLALACSWSILH